MKKNKDTVQDKIKKYVEIHLFMYNKLWCAKYFLDKKYKKKMDRKYGGNFHKYVINFFSRYEE